MVLYHNEKKRTINFAKKLLHSGANSNTIVTDISIISKFCIEIAGTKCYTIYSFIEKGKYIMEMNEKEKNINKNTEKANRKKYIIVISILIIICVVFDIYFLLKNNNNNETEEKKEVTVKIDDLGTNAVCYDLYNEKDVLYKFITLDEEIAYSIDYECDEPNGDTVTFRNYLSDQAMAIMINGYPNNTLETMGCANEDEAYMATQMAIWEVMNRTGESKKAGQIFRVDNVTPISGKEEFYNRVVTAAKKLIKDAENNPYTSVPTMTIDNAKVDKQEVDEDNILIGPYIVEISGTDASTIDFIKASLIEAPESARVVDENGIDKTILSNGDTVYVKMKKPEEKVNFKVKFEANINRKVGEIYEETNKMTQDYVKIGTLPNKMEKELTINVDVVETLGKIHLECVDEDNNPIGGSTFSLNDSNGKLLGEVTTGADGLITYYKVPEGEYTIKQTVVPDGYELQEASESLTVRAGETTDVKFINKYVGQ